MVPQRAGRYTDEMTKHHSRTEAGKWNTLHFFFTTDVLVSKCAVKTNHMQERRTLPGGDLIEPYLKGIALKISNLINRSINDLQPATIIYGIGKCDLAANRDYWDEDNQT